MPVLYTILGILLLIILLLFLPLTASVKFENDFFVNIKFLGITVYKIGPDGNSKTETANEKAEKSDKKQQEDGLFTKLKKKNGFLGAVKEIFWLLSDFIKTSSKELSKIKFRKSKLDLIVVGDDAAQTAIDYGLASALVYPIVSYIDSNFNVKLRQINVEAGFKHTKSEFSFSVKVKANTFLLLIIAFKALKEYKKFSVRNELQ